MPGLLDFWVLLQTPSARRECVLVRGLCSGVLRRSWCLVWRMGAMSKRLAELAREVARVQGQPAGKRGGRRDQRRKPANAGAEVRMGDVWTTTPPLAHAGRSFDVSRWKVGRIALRAKSCEGTRSATDHQTPLGRFLEIWKGARSIWSKTSKSTVPQLRARTIALSKEFTITMVHRLLLQ